MTGVRPHVRFVISAVWSTVCAGCADRLSPVDSEADPRQADAAEELIEIIHSYLT
jgi:hypothetical protein